MSTNISPRKSFWIFQGEEKEKVAFGSLESTLQCLGDQVSKDPLSYVLRCRVAKRTYYIKVYQRNGKGVRNYLGRGRAQGEWQNLSYFASLGIPTPRLVAYGQNYHGGRLLHAVLITAEVSGAQDLATLAKEQPERFELRSWRRSILQQVADYTARLHHNGFVHWDLKWRNILVQQQEEIAGTEPHVLFFDCPLGKHPFGWLRKRGAIKDLACLDKIGMKMLSNTDRLRFYRSYRGCQRLTAKDKKQIAKITTFFSKKS